MNYSALEALGYDAGIYWIPKYFTGGRELFKVYVGPYKTPEEAQAILPAIKKLQPDAYVMKYGMVDVEGKTVIPFEYADVYQVTGDDQIQLMDENGILHSFDKQGNSLLPRPKTVETCADGNLRWAQYALANDLNFFLNVLHSVSGAE